MAPSNLSSTVPVTAAHLEMPPLRETVPPLRETVPPLRETVPPLRDVGLMCDLDGLTLDTQRPQHLVYQALILEHFGIETSARDFAWTIGASREETVRGFNERYGGLPLRTGEGMKTGEAVGEFIVRRLIEIRRPQERAGIDLSPMPGLTDLLTFSERARLPRSISTSRPEAHAREILCSVSLDNSFHAVVGSDSPGVTAVKPAPDVFVRSAEALSIRLRESWAIEDSRPGVLAARAAGTQVLYVPDRRLGDPCLSTRRHATHTVDSLEDAARFLERELGMSS